jgi:hypothetical protein
MFISVLLVIATNVKGVHGWLRELFKPEMEQTAVPAALTGPWNTSG